MTDTESDASGDPERSRMDIQIPTRDSIREICTAQSFQRGVEYFEAGQVRDLTVADSEVTATVRGSHDYRTTVDLSATQFAPRCSCPYDYDGECKHVVAVLLAVADRSDELLGDRSDTSDYGDEAAQASNKPMPRAVERAVDEADDETVRTFLSRILAEDEHRREQFLALVDGPAEKSAADYRREIDQRFEDAAGQHDIVEYDTRLDFSQYYDRADTYRENANAEQALKIYRALAETIHENLDRIDDSSGHYGDQVARAVETYAETVREMDRSPEERHEYIDSLFEQYRTTEFDFVGEYYDEALRAVCETTADLEHLRSLLEPHVPADLPLSESDLPDENDSGNGEDGPTGEGDVPIDGSTATRVPDPTRDRLDADLFTGGATDVDRLSAIPLDIEAFVGETLTEKIEAFALEGDARDASRSGSQYTPHERTLLSTYVWVLSELDERDTLRAILADVYTERPSFCRQYVDELLADDRDDRAEDVVEDGLDQFTHSHEFHRFAAEFYDERDDDRYRERLRTLFVRFEDWDAYDELKTACSDERWESVFHGIVTQLGRLDPDRLIDLYCHEGEREKALSRVLDSEDVATLKRYRADVADLDPEKYFEAYQERLEPYLASDTGRDHYRTVIEHLREMERLGFEDELDAFVARLREKHSNRPAFLDELDTAGF